MRGFGLRRLLAARQPPAGIPHLAFRRFFLLRRQLLVNRLIAFRNADEIEEFADGEVCHFLGNISVNVWNGRSSLQFVAEEAIG